MFKIWELQFKYALKFWKNHLCLPLSLNPNPTFKNKLID
jgi:hypothetical protein